MTNMRSAIVPVRLLTIVTVSILLLSTFFLRGDNALTKSKENALLAPNLSATKIGALDTSAGGDVNGNSIVNPGDRLTYTVTVNNAAGADPATGVNFSDTLDANTTLVSGSVIVSPVAANDAFTSIGNVGITVPDGAGDLLANDFNPNGSGALTITSAPSVSAQGGNLSISTTTGAFTYNPAPGFEGTDSFSYTLSNGTGLTDNATVTIQVSGMIWFVNSAAGAGGDGRLGTPFNCYTGANCFSAVAADDAGNNIFLYSGSYTGGYTLLNNQKLIGQGSSGALASIAGVATIPPYSNALPVTGGANPTVTTSVAVTNAVNLGQGNTIRGLTLGNTTGAKVFGNSFGTLTIGNNAAPDVILNGTGQALNLTTGTFAATSALASLATTSSAAQGVSLAGVAGTVAFGSTTVSGSTTQGILVGTSTANINFGNTSVTGGTDAISLQNNSAGTRTFGTIQTTNNSGIGFVHAVGGGIVSVTGAAAFTNPGGRCVDIQDSTAAVTFADLNATQCGGTGVFLDDNSGNVTFADLDISPDSGQRGIQAQEPHAGAITSTSGTISTTNQPAVDVAGTSAASRTPLNVRLTSVSANGGNNGVILQNTSATGSPGGFSILGNSNGLCGGQANPLGSMVNPVSADCTGGTIQNTVGMTGTNNGIGVLLNTVQNVNLTRVNLSNNPNYGLKGTSVSNFTMTSSYVTNNGDDVGGEGEGGVYFFELTGSASVTNSYIHLGAARNLEVLNTAGTLDRITVSGTVIGNDGTSGSDGIFFQADNSANPANALTLKATVQDGRFLGSRGDGTQFSARGTSVTDFVFTNNTMTNNHSNQVSGSMGVTLSSGGSAGSFSPTNTFNISNNRINNNSPNNASGVAISVGKGGISATGSFTGTISNNVIGTAGVANSGSAQGSGIVVDIVGGGSMNATITNNTIRQFSNNGILVQSGGTTAGGGQGYLTAVIQGNTIAEPSPLSQASVFPTNGIRAVLGTNLGDTSKNCITIGGSTAAQKNTVNGTGTNGAQDLRLFQRFTTILGVPGYAGVNNDNTAMQNFLISQNLTNPTALASNNTGAGGPGYSGTCPASLAQFTKPYIENDRNEIGDNLNFLNLTYKSPLEMPMSLQFLLGYSVKTETISQERIAASVESVTETPVESNTNHQATFAAYFSNTANAFSEIINEIGSAISPTAHAQKEKSNDEKLSPESGDTVTKSLGTLPAGEQIVVQFKATVDASIPTNDFSVANTANITAAGGININSTTATTTVVHPPMISMSFGSSFIGVNGTTALTFTIGNANPSTNFTNVAFTDTLPVGLVVANPNAIVNNCGGGTVTAVAGSNSISVAALSRNAATSCTIVVNVTANSEGAKNNVTGTISSTQGGTGLTASATLNVIAAPTFTKAFSASSIQLNGTTTLSFTITNTSQAFPLNNVSFTDNLVAGLVVATPPNQTGTCGGTITANAGASSISLAGATLAANANCTFSVNVTGTTAGVKNNSVQLLTTELGAGATATASITVIAPPTIAKAFAPTSIVAGGTSTVTLTLTNSNTTGALTGATFTDMLSNMSAVGGAVGGNCAGTTPATLAAGATNLNFSGITIPNNGSCTVTFSIKSSSVGTNPNTTSGITTNQTPVAGTASNTANLTVIAAADLTITKTHAGNFTQGDTGKTYTIAVTNSGGTPSSGTVTVTDTLPSGLTATAISGTGWSCALGTLTCTRSDVLNNGSSYPAITLTVNVTNNAPASVTNTASVSGGAELNAGNNAASDPTTINAAATYSISGQVTNGGEGLSGVSVALSGASNASTTTDAAGNYSFSSLAGSVNYTVTTTLNGYTFNPINTAVNNLTSNQTAVNFATSTVSYEGDVVTRPTGDGSVDIFDLIATSNIIANQPGTTPLASGGEYQRADAAPRSSKGDGSVDVQDLIQMGLYAAANNPLTPAGGPTTAAPPAMPIAVASKADTDQTGADRIDIDPVNTFINQPSAPLAGSATVSAGMVNSSAGSTAIIPIQLSSTNVGGVQFTVTYESAKLSIPSLAAITDQASGTSFTFNNSTPGQLGVIAFRSTAGTAFPASTLLFNINFTVKAGAPAGASQIGFGITPVPIKASDPTAEAATITTTNGAVTIVGSTAATVRVSGWVITGSGARGISGVRLSLTDSQGNVRETVSDKSGYYRFEDVEVGSSCIITATGKRYFFSQPSQVLNINEETEEVNFIANSENRLRIF
jgi:uncharacterized repeat protein (TIGR01451 family)